MFLIYFMGSLAVEGTIRLISIMTLDSTNCWSNTVLNYNLNYTNTSFNVSVTPLNCKISHQVTAELQFEYATNVWHSFPIYPTPGLAGGYNDDNDYQHSQTFFFNQSMDMLHSEEERFFMRQMINSFYSNRSTAFKLVLTTVVNGIPSIFSNLIKGNMGFNSSFCSGGYNFPTTSTAQYQIIQVAIHLSTYCPWLKKGNLKTYSLVLQSVNGWW